MVDRFYIVPIGVIEKQQDETFIRIYDPYTDGLLGIEGFSHVYVLYWFNKNDTPENRKMLQVHPRKDNRNPLTGVFATHSPLRPNLIALTLCKIISIEGNLILIEAIDAFDGSPVIDIKAYIPEKINEADIRLPSWV